MSGALSSVVSGLNAAVSSATQSVRNMVNASSTGKNIDADLVNLKSASVDYAANATAMKIVGKMQKSLLDIEV